MISLRLPEGMLEDLLPGGATNRCKRVAPAAIDAARQRGQVTDLDLGLSFGPVQQGHVDLAPQQPGVDLDLRVRGDVSGQLRVIALDPADGARHQVEKRSRGACPDRARVETGRRRPLLSGRPTSAHRDGLGPGKDGHLPCRLPPEPLVERPEVLLQHLLLRRMRTDRHRENRGNKNACPGNGGRPERSCLRKCSHCRSLRAMVAGRRQRRCVRRGVPGDLAVGTQRGHHRHDRGRHEPPQLLPSRPEPAGRVRPRPRCHPHGSTVCPHHRPHVRPAATPGYAIVRRPIPLRGGRGGRPRREVWVP